jgi:hypothetical protein
MASNAASRQNTVPFGGGNSKYNLDGQTARQTLEAKSWAFTDGGLDTWDVNIQTTNINETFGIQLFGNNPNLFVLWGDGNTEMLTTTGDKTTQHCFVFS